MNDQALKRRQDGRRSGRKASEARSQYTKMLKDERKSSIFSKPLTSLNEAISEQNYSSSLTKDSINTLKPSNVVLESQISSKINQYSMESLNYDS